MSGFDDLIPDAMPYLATEAISATCGTTWQWEYELKDNPGNLVDMTTGFTGFAIIVTADSTIPVVSVGLIFPAPGIVRCSITAATSAAVAPGNYFHEVTITRTSDSKKIILVGAGDSSFRVKRKAS